MAFTKNINYTPFAAFITTQTEEPERKHVS